MRRVTIKEIAKVTGYSVNTVSRALSNRGEIKKETAELISKVASDMGYVPNLLAKGLAGKRTNTIGLIMGETQNPYHWPVVEIIQKELTRRGLKLVLANSEETEDGLHNAVNLLLSSRVDGLFMFFPDKGEDSLRLLMKHKVPTVLLSTKSEIISTSYVECDDEKGGYLAASHLLDRGCKRIAYIAREGETYPCERRREGYKRALLERGLDFDGSLIFRAPSSLSGGYDAASKIDFLANEIDGVVAHNDLLAMGVMRNLIERGINVPDKVAVIGFDNIPYSEYCYPPLTTIDTKKEEIGIRSVEMLLRHIDIKLKEDRVPFEKITLDPKLIKRQSS